jgi:hypothetical protein
MEVDMDVGDWLDSLLPSAQNTIRYPSPYTTCVKYCPSILTGI